MARDVPVDDAQGWVVLGWRSREDGLFLRARNQTDEVRLRCICGRCHWIVRELFSGGTATLLLSCHNCGQKRTFLTEGMTTHLP